VNIDTLQLKIDLRWPSLLAQ